MARPRKPDHERRRHELKFVATDIERARIEQAAAAYGLTLSEFFRRRALGGTMPAAAADRQQAAEATTALLRLGVNLNQIAKHINAGRTPPMGAITDLIERINAGIDQLDLAMGQLYEPGRSRTG